ncbi:hypothetical protein PHYSODRAFT_336496 [Phytophthora sojae]|uniref:Serine-threonine/tyrosine-protein kinase catalytic domain-containing protein n=1 Tax=Phytophthora sojae (strain P6497) TaxID=1094619 RepID=G4ZYH2_PHYSP|nr:hypothetical protein PHYSODRAFT_336496 [Phytophthora sojae]EGZ12024.1 hypothetical protein PHYSODRAFT_336496 [Phytophthora sojae]|eukprot:XP_009532357.1 hypothetical protein PHYSODRAFT_336496 [Phytophthora sojae]
MCVVEALRVVEAVNTGKDSRGCLPWRVADRNVVRYHATHGTLPARPKCSNSQWELVVRMCALDPKQRIKISTVVDELARLANSGVNTQAMAEPDTLSADVTNRVSVPDMIAAARHELARLAKPVVESPMRVPPNGVKRKRPRRWLASWRVLVSSAKRCSCSTLPDDVTDAVSTPGARQGTETLQGNTDQVISLCSSLWERLERVHEQITVITIEDCCTSFHLLVVDAHAATTKLQVRERGIMALAETTMRFYALGRALTKFCEAYFVDDVNAGGA